MMRTALATVVVVMLTAGAARAKDVPPPTPAPASRPAAATAEDVARLREQVKALAAAVDALRAEVAALKGGGGRAVAPAAADPKAVDEAMRAGRLAVGMTMEQVRKVLEEPTNERGRLLNRSASAEEWEWEISRSMNVTGEGRTEELGTQVITCRFRGGRLASFSRRD
jgi:hypothetical protein